MTKAEKKETKLQIIHVARELFSQFGYDGTSVRQIAEKSGVNIAAINYHFRNKHGLYWSLINEAHDWLEEGVATRVQKATNLESLIQSIFSFMIESKSFVRSTMKAFLTDGVPEPDPGHPYLEKMTPENFGPPGGKHLAQFLNEKYGDEAKPEAIEWAVLSIFSSMVHWATMCSTSSFESVKQTKGLMSDEMVEENIIRMARAVVRYMCDKTVWSAP